ncbi:hypothetical protein OCU04_008134 [Sclerotinia nivalis]|uniref:Uncharacterized protein n=1 Tax=Sclerotinia nivalis TaxID=352851 RepID=A0A9X0DIH9_9HELO|nr:hypothetical protein OCU04_008134 [Sclerotinia nivalis]
MILRIFQCYWQPFYEFPAHIFLWCDQCKFIAFSKGKREFSVLFYRLYTAFSLLEDAGFLISFSPISFVHDRYAGGITNSTLLFFSRRGDADIQRVILRGICLTRNESIGT